MPIAREGRFLLTHDLNRGSTSLGLESSMLCDCIEEVQREGYAGVFGNPEFGFNETTLDALTQLPQLRHVWFWDIHLKNIDGLYALQQLETFGVHQRRPPVAFERLPSLRQIVWEYRPRDTGLETLPLDMLHLWRYAPKHASFAGLMLPDTLEELDINWCNPASLEGLPRLPNVRRLGIHQCRHMSSLAAIPDLFPALEHLVVDACGRMPVEEEGERLVEQMPGLKHAFVQKRVVTKG
ncbi:hypothetical protein [Stenotrophomonas sp. PS02289]|uniref:hypothetical protein n=1 Tax=Stenotrophomonas sp. PS02289 TaxID=2991422 RepID=UPI002499C4F2|nr:hypothetical protein [Stenotrophomonas sp. PS02289]